MVLMTSTLWRRKGSSVWLESRRAESSRKNQEGFFEAAAGVEQYVFAGDFDAHGRNFCWFSV